MYSNWCFRALFILVQFTAILAQTPKITNIEPHEGSYQGSTRLYINGEGFSSSGNFQQGETELGNKAYLLSDMESVPCDVENDASHETMIVCYTRPMKKDHSYFIKIAVDGYEVPFEQNCNENPRDSQCRFIPRWYKTPKLKTCHVTQDGVEHPIQTAHTPGSLITCSGRIFTQIYGSNNQTNANGRTVSIRRAYAGGRKCELVREPDVFYDLRLTNGDDGTFTCMAEGTAIGVQNASLIVADDFGRADIEKKMLKINSKDKVYHFQTYAEITGISPQVGSVEGGTHISISGRNFDDTTEPLQVLVGGIPCTVIPGTLTPDGVECFAGNPPVQKEFYTGSRGILLEVWNDTLLDNEDTLKLTSSDAKFEDAIVLDSTAWWWNDDKDNFVAKYTGVFVAPRTDRYKFKIAADHSASLYVNCDGSRKLEDLTRVAYTDLPDPTYRYPFQSSDWMALYKDQECFFVGVVRELEGNAYMYIGVHRATTTLTASQSNDAKNEIQFLDFSAVILREKQAIDFTGWSNQDGVVEEQEITVTHPCIDSGNCFSVGYRLVYEDVKTAFIAADASAPAVREALRGIFELSDEDVEVSVETGSNEHKYTVQFNMKRGDYALLDYVKIPSDVQELTVAVTEKTKGVSERKTFKLRLAGRATSAISENADAAAIHEALDATRIAQCPSYLLPDIRKSTVVATIDYETTKYGEEFGDRKQLCLAHRGLMSKYWELTGTFRGTGRYTISGTHQFTNPLITHETEWRYSCIDLLEVIIANEYFSHVNEVRISIIRFERKGLDYNYYLDAITIGSTKTTEDYEGTLLMRTPPALANGWPLEEVTVTDAGGGKAYEIEIETHECGDDIPLISTAAGSGDGFVATRLETGVAPMEGEFDLTVNFHDGSSYNVTGIPVDISNEKFAERLEAEVPVFGEARVSNEGGCHAKDFGIEWLTNGGDKPPMELHMRNISGASDINAVVLTSRDGGVLHHPATGDMLRLAYDNPQVEVFVNGYASKCVGDCQFVTSDDATPVISNISPLSGSPDLGTSVTITGTNLDVVGPTSTSVKIGVADCAVTSNSATSITCDLGDGALGTYDLTVNVGGKGLVRKQSESVSNEFTIAGGIQSLNPTNGLESGGTKVVISGYGFSENTVFKFQSNTCEILGEFTSTEVTCITPKSSSEASTSSVTATDGAISLISSVTFEYQANDAVVTSITPTTSLLGGGQNLTITGSKIGQEGVVVRVGEGECKVLQTSTGQIICTLPSLPAGGHNVYVIIQDRGYADTTTNNISPISYDLEVTGVSPNVGSIYGGNLITIDGAGFDPENTIVKFGDSVCEIQSLTETKMECITGSFTKVHTVTNNGRHPVHGNGFAWDQTVLHIGTGDTVVWNWEFNGAPGGWDYGAVVFTTASPDSDAYDEVTFQSSTVKTEKGSYRYTFNNEGAFFISSGRVDHPDWGTIVMKQSVTVGSAQASKHRMSLTVSGHEAVYTSGESSQRKKRSTCGGTAFAIGGCVPATLEADASGFSVIADTCYSPKITSITPNSGTTDTTMTIEGEGFGTENCANQVIIGAGYPDEYECQILTSSSASIACKPSPTASTSINVAYYVKVNVDDLGDSGSVILLDTSRRFSLLPSMSSVSPSVGSLAGETLVTISGSGFPASGLGLSATIGGFTCHIQSVTYFEIQCHTPSSTAEGEQDVAVTIKGQPAECTTTCTFEYATASTPTITNVSPTLVNAANTEIVITGTAFTADNNAIDVTIGVEDCPVTTSSTIEIRCTIAELSAGSHSLHVSIDDVGKASFSGTSVRISSPAEITSMTPVAGSKAGGTKLTFTGNGFNAEDLKVKVGDSLCIIDPENVTNFMFNCRTSSGTNSRSVHVTANWRTFNLLIFEYSTDLTPEITSITPAEGKAGEVVTVVGSHFVPGDMKVSIGTADCTSIAGDATSITCVLGEHVGGEYSVTADVSDVGYANSAVLFNYTFTVTGVSPASGSHAGGDLVTITGQGFSDRAIVTICDRVCDQGSETSDSNASITEISCRVAGSFSSNIETDEICDITVSVDGQSVKKNDMYTFAADKTPKVTGINPPRGGTQGGTEVTITGILFDTDDSKVSVEIGGVVCDVNSSTATQIVCTTNSRGHSVKAMVKVNIDGKGLAVNTDVDFYYVDVWSSEWTWGGLSPPVAGDFVVVPTGQTLLIDVDTPVLKMLLIQGGVVIFGEKDIHLQAENILVTDGGVFQVGTEEEPFQHKAVITLHGNLRSPELPIYGTKTIGVRNGTLDLHGKHVPITWTHLKETAAAGMSTIVLKDAVTWQVGDEIVIASTGDHQSQKETETAFISAISSDKRTLTLSAALEYKHISASEQFEGVLLETCAEVGLLTRNVVIEGSKHMEWARDEIPACPEGFNTAEFGTQTCFQGRFGEEEGSDQFGAQIMIHHKSPDLDLARARLEYVELRQVGQAFRLGRYPIHFHLLGDVNFNNYVRGCAIHRSFNRAITIHNTHHLMVERNVIYDIMGGAVFIEDGIEHGNIIQYNLVIFCKQSTSLQNDDITPAAYWITNPNNTHIHNAAAGGTHFGFWYRIHEHPDGPSFDATICQRLHPLQRFENNTVHSQGWFGLWIFKDYTPRGDGSCNADKARSAEFRSLTAWNCEKGAESVNVGAVQFFNFIMAHNSKVGIETVFIIDKSVRWGQVGTYDSFIISSATALTEGKSTERGIILPFTEGYEVKNTKFINFNEWGTAGIGVTSVDGICSRLCGGWEARFTNTSFQNSPNKAAFRWEHEIQLRDIDGTLGGNNQHSLIFPHNPTISLSDCPKVGGFDFGEFDGVRCDGSAKFHRVSWNQVFPTSLEAKWVTFTNADGSSFIPFAEKRLTHKKGWMGTMKDGETYKWVFEGAEQITNISYSAMFWSFEENDCVIVAHNVAQKPDKYEIAPITTAQDNMVTCTDNYHGDYYFNAGSKTLYYIVSGRDRLQPSSRKKRYATEGAVHRVVNFKVFRCFYENCIPPPDPNSLPPARARPDVYQMWHDSSFWTINADGEYVGTANGDGSTSHPPNFQDVRIESDTWMVVKEDLPKLNKLWIEGVLEIENNDPNLDVTLSATHVVVMGGRLIVGWEDALFKGTASFVLRGDHNTENIDLSGGSLGSKAIGVLGGLDMHGLERDLRTTHLANTLTAGQNTITVEGSPSDWAAGDEIAIATTSADPWETEIFKVVSVSDKTVTLNASARFEHMAETFSFESDGTRTYDIRAEVSMLTRNIKVIGEDYSDLFEESFGARILIMGSGAGGDRGYARIENVEFYHTGQEGWIDNYDPRYSLAFLNTGDVDTVKPSIVKRNTFHNGFNTAIGVFGAKDLNVVENVIHHTVGPGIRVEGWSTTLDSNLVMLTRTRSVYKDRQEMDIMLWKAAIEVNLATKPVLIGNVVAGSERAGYRIDGHDCGGGPYVSNVEWGWNTARATLQGIWMNRDGFHSCSLISKFNIHNAYDYAIYYQGKAELKMSDILITDSPLGFTAIVHSPHSLRHSMENKRITIENSAVVAVSKPEYCPTLSRRDTDYLQNSPLARMETRPGTNGFGRVAILWPAFLSDHNTAPSMTFLGAMSYPALGGQTVVNNLTFVNFDDTSCSPHNTIFMTNVKMEDFLHPITTSNLKFVDSSEDTYVYLHRPTVTKINPTDCVDMECDGMKKALIVDKDGSMLGSPGSSVIPQAEFEWDGDPRRGLGDHRIPKTLLTGQDGSRLSAADLFPNKGILRANTADTNCVQNDVWQAHKCQGCHHGILIVESMDADTETRRLSPVALAADGYIDLNNGPQDHGWCAGYTCQKRLSTFWIIVAMQKVYDLHFTGSSPQKLRLRLLDEESATKIVLRIYFSRPQRQDVYIDGNYQIPINSEINDDGQQSVLPEVYPGQYHPTIYNFTGDNYHDRVGQTLHVTLGGGGAVVETHEANVLVLKFNLPAVSPDEFFDNGKLVQNLAMFLGISANKIRLVNAVREGSASGRRKQELDSFEATIEIGDPPAPTIDDSATPATTAAPDAGGTTHAWTTPSSTSTEELFRAAASLANALQQGTLSEALGTPVASMAMANPRIEPVANSTNSTDDVDAAIDYYVPSGLRVVEQPHTGIVGIPLSPVLTVTGIRASGTDIVLGHRGDPWEATVTVENGDKSAKLSGTTIATFDAVTGSATFEGLAIPVTGSFALKITVTHPTGNTRLNVVTDAFTLSLSTATTTTTSTLSVLSSAITETTTLSTTTSSTTASPSTKNILFELLASKVAVVVIACGLLAVAIIVVLIAKIPELRANPQISTYPRRHIRDNLFLTPGPLDAFPSV